MLKQLTTVDLRKEGYLAHAVWASLEKIGGKQKAHDQLKKGASHQICLQIEGSVDGERFSQTIHSVIRIGYDCERKTSATPQQARLLAFLLSKLNQTTRDYLLRCVPDEFARHHQQIPPVDETIVRQADEMLARLRAEKRIQARGAIRCEYSMQ